MSCGLVAVCSITIGCTNQAGEASAKDSMAQQSDTLTVKNPSAVSKTTPNQIEWFRGVADLPASHPCHDSTPVVYARNSVDSVHDHFEMSTLGELSKRLKPEEKWVYFDPRAVRGVRWTDATGEYLVVTCHLAGSGFEKFQERTFRDGLGDWDPNIESENAKFIIGYVGEPNHVQRGALRRMRRGEDGRWESLNKTVLWANDDEGNNPEFIAVAELIAVEDADENGLPEVVAMTVHNLESSDQAESGVFCPWQDPKYRCIYFEMNIIATEGDQELVQRVWLHMDASQARVDKIARPEAMSDKAFAALSAALEAHGPAAILKATEILRDAKKLTDTPERFDPRRDR